MIFRRALSDTLSGQITALFVLVSGGGLSLVYLYVSKGSKMALEEVPYVTGAILGAIGSLFLLFLWNLACAPYRLERDAHAVTRAKMADMESRLPRAKPRMLSVEQQGKITELLRSSVAELSSLNVLHYASDEAVDFAVSIGDAISLARIDCDVHDGALFEKPPKDRGVKIYQTGEPEMQDLAQGLCKLLVDFGFPCEVRKETQKVPAVFIYVARQSET